MVSCQGHDGARRCQARRPSACRTPAPGGRVAARSSTPRRTRAAPPRTRPDPRPRGSGRRARARDRSAGRRNERSIQLRGGVGRPSRGATTAVGTPIRSPLAKLGGALGVRPHRRGHALRHPVERRGRQQQVVVEGQLAVLGGVGPAQELVDDPCQQAERGVVEREGEALWPRRGDVAVAARPRPAAGAAASGRAAGARRDRRGPRRRRRS
jgi:hypothetical protein